MFWFKEYNQAFSNDGDESGIDTSSQFTPNIHYNSISVNKSNANLTNHIPNVLNTSSISFDLMNLNAPAVKTRYDVKSQGSGSLYGSKVKK